MDRYDREQIDSMQDDCDDSKLMCACCNSHGKKSIADEPVLVAKHYGGWASALEDWIDLGTSGWLVPMCNECAFVTREDQAIERD